MVRHGLWTPVLHVVGSRFSKNDSLGEKMLRIGRCAEARPVRITT